MADLKSRVAYLQGLATGLDMPADSKEARLLSGIVDVMGEFADSVDELEASQDGLEDYVESVDEDLYVLERRVSRAGGEEDECDGLIQIECPECILGDEFESADADIPTVEMINEQREESERREELERVDSGDN